MTLCGSSKGEEKPGNEVRGGRALVSDANPLAVVSRRRNVVESVTKSGVRDNLKKTGVCGARRGGENALGDSKGVSDAGKVGESTPERRWTWSARDFGINEESTR